MNRHELHPVGSEPPAAPPPGAGIMNVVRRLLLGVLVLLAVGSLATWFLARREAARGTVATATTYYCPMHPSYTLDRRGECPICGMALEPMPEAEHAGEAGDVPGLAVVEIAPERLQLIGVRTAIAELKPLGSEISLVASVTPDESRVRRVQLRVAGWVQQLHQSRTGDFVRQGEPLLTLYSPELYQTELEFLIEMGVMADTITHEGMAAPRAHTLPHDAGGIEAAHTRLRLMGVPELEIQRLERERRAESHLALQSPVTGTVLERGVAEGQFVSADTPLLTVADLSTVWVLADLYEMDLPRVRPGDRATFTADALPGRPFEATIEFVYPTVSSQTRTTQARVSLANPEGRLRPGMYGRLHVRGRSAPVLSVPAEAVIHAGADEYVFVAHTGGRFEPRRVRTGVQYGEQTEIRHGLAAGDTVVASASFLIDSESRLKAAISGLGATPGAHDHENRP